jgi:hypothetical protein
LGDFSQRSNEQEIMDGGIGSFELFDESLKQIEAVNHLTLGYRPMLSWVDRQLQSPELRPVPFRRGLRQGATCRRIWFWRGRKQLRCVDGRRHRLLSAPAARRATPEYMGVATHRERLRHGY